MKDILELIADNDEHGNSFIFVVKSLLAKQLNLAEESLRIENSGSRSWEEGPSTDLRTYSIIDKEKIKNYTQY